MRGSCKHRLTQAHSVIVQNAFLACPHTIFSEAILTLTTTADACILVHSYFDGDFLLFSDTAVSIVAKATYLVLQKTTWDVNASLFVCTFNKEAVVISVAVEVIFQI